LILATANTAKELDSFKTKNIMMMTITITTNTMMTMIITSSIQTMHSPKFPLTPRRLHPVFFAANVPAPHFKAQNFATSVARLSISF
jgi:hypothetical protein